MEIGLQDISSSNAGRTESTLMMKERIGKAPRYDIYYTNVTSSVAEEALNLVSSEYFNVLYPDFDNGGNYAFGQFYRGDVKLSPYNGELDIWSSVNFPIIKRDGTTGIQATSVINDTQYTFVVNTTALSGNITISVITRAGTIETSPSDQYTGIIANSGADGTVIFRDANNKTIVVNVKR